MFPHQHHQHTSRKKLMLSRSSDSLKPTFLKTLGIKRVVLEVRTQNHEGMITWPKLGYGLVKTIKLKATSKNLLTIQI